MLEDEADPPLADALVGRVGAVEMDRPRVGRLEAGDDAQQRGLARARGPEQRDQLAGVDPQIDLVDRGEGAEAPADVANFDGHDGLVPGRGYDSRRRQATRLFSTSVTTASSVSTEATANAAANSYSL